MRSVKLNLSIFAPEKETSNIELSCSAVGLSAASKKLSRTRSAGPTGGIGIGITSIIGGLRFGGEGLGHTPLREGRTIPLGGRTPTATGPHLGGRLGVLLKAGTAKRE